MQSILCSMVSTPWKIYCENGWSIRHLPPQIVSAFGDSYLKKFVVMCVAIVKDHLDNQRNGGLEK